MKKNKENFSLNNYIDAFIDWIFKGLKEFSKAINSQHFDDIIKVILKIILALVIVSILRIPFELIKYFFNNIFDLFPYTYKFIFNGFFNILMEIIYIMASVVVLTLFIKDISISNTKLDFDSKKIVNPIVAVLKSFLIILLIPLVILTIALLFILAIMIISTITKIYLIGFYFIELGLIIISVVSMIMVIKSLNRGDK